MHSRNKVIGLILIFMMTIVLSGCVNADYHVKVNMDGSGVYEMKILTNKLVLEELKDLKKSLQDDGYKIKTITEDGKTGWIAKKEVANVIDEPPGKRMQDHLSTLIQPKPVASTDPITGVGLGTPLFLSDLNSEQVKVNTGLLFIRANVDMEADLSDVSSDNPMAEAFMDQVKLRFLLTLPIEPDSHNADHVSDDGKTLTWNMEPGKKNPIQLSIKIPNPVFWVPIIIVTVLFLIGFVVWLIIRNRRKRKSASQAA
ncbi:DUF3153 domain-containing protein [Melghirimyces algeriensis]|uniref:DUF3153 domain-containing protein n=1 Tax=Melghirimyces algeriensis TaxID=910412 RepID=A0A521ES81_9BACL|nr:DUF3153 domain-containing protein [Melghirimyces algeriensis]SMO86796.1 Protein of unknown function [Melghirimyces algeriensis]